MSKEEKLMKAVVKATGDDTTSDAAEFQPTGTADATGAGAAAVSLG